ncbi:vacuolar protein sorting-associated protein 62 [Artemisia annua]|uniref:Vacuolar protein sorting-associated protein 62 n=1 Tax=Artemisia annua TaxID=35608 RepID=A0A2U1LKX6_ARTAN|nr:vacuolar protein sorting-associated protein 62 [Artemisia annua]
MVRSDPYFAMPNSLQIKTMIGAYAPWVYFHPDEEYFPSSVLWFFNNGADIYQVGGIHWPVIKDGELLPDYGILGDAYQRIVSSTCAWNDFSTTLDPNNVEDDTEVVSFNLPGPSPSYPTGGDFGKGAIDLGGLEVYQALYFKKIWSTHIGGTNGLGATFYEPVSIPEGFNLLGHYCKQNSKPLFASVLTAKDTTDDPWLGALLNPIDYKLIWTSKGTNISQSVDGYIWLPIPPDGYKAVGHIVTTSPEKPSFYKTKCVRSDLTDLIQVDKLIWGYKENTSQLSVNVYTTTPIHKMLSVPVGTFFARSIGEDKHELVCLKMVRSDPYFAMPNSLQIKTMIGAYAPWVYFHPNEKYFPSSVLWFFNNGAEIYQVGGIHWPVINDGELLPDYGTVDDAYLDLPSDEAYNKEKAKRGFLHDAIAYIHVKRALGGTFTDLAIWLYYPFNGAGKVQIGPFTIKLSQIGEHVGDWEHITLRIDNFSGILKSVYLSQHAKGKWFSPTEFEFVEGTRPVVYASLHGHTHYNTPGAHLHLKEEINQNDMKMLYNEFNSYSKKSPIVRGEKYVWFGIRDDAAKSKNVMDIASKHDVVCVDNMDSVLKPWLNYTGRWGPKITYEYKSEILKATSYLPDKVEALAKKLLEKVPAEVFGEEGPEGPKMKDSWTGDERV